MGETRWYALTSCLYFASPRFCELTPSLAKTDRSILVLVMGFDSQVDMDIAEGVLP